MEDTLARLSHHCPPRCTVNTHVDHRVGLVGGSPSETVLDYVEGL